MDLKQHDSDFVEERISGEERYHGKILHLWIDRARMPDGKEAVRELVRHPGGVAVVPLTAAGEVLMVRQYRYPYGEILTEIPAGKRDPGEEPAATGRRELEEEAGVTADHFVSLGTLYPSPGYTDEVIWLYLATGLHQTAAHPDEDEFLRVERVPLDEAIDRVLAGEIPDAKTQTALLKTQALLRQGVVEGVTV